MRNRTFNASFGKTEHAVRINDAEVVQRGATAAGIPVQWLSDLSDADVGFASSTHDRLIGSLLDSNGQIKFVRIPGAEPVIRDYAGRLVNLASEDIQEILRFLPDAVGNPIRRELLAAYFDLRNYQSYSAEQRIRRLLVDPELAEKLTYTTGMYTREYVEALLHGAPPEPKGEKQ